MKSLFSRHVLFLAITVSLQVTPFATAMATSNKTSFDCTKARTTVEIAICSDKQLANADSEMDALYEGLLARMSEDEKIQLEKDQRYWLENRELCGSSKVIFDCLKGAYDNRISTLKYIKPTKAKVRRLAPSAFTTLPEAIRRSLESRNCTVPQAYDNASPHNAISGEFLKKGQKDWAVLCSHDGSSSILIFWNGSTSKITELSPSPDDDWFQSFGAEYGFSREIRVAGKKQIEAYHDFAKKYTEEPDLPPITHDGIDQFFVNKASSVFYYYQGRWLTVSGAD